GGGGEAGRLAVRVGGQRRRLRGGHQLRVPEAAGAVRPSQGWERGIASAPIRDGARVARLHVLSAFRSGRAAGSPPAGPVVTASGSPRAVPTDRGGEGSTSPPLCVDRYPILRP